MCYAMPGVIESIRDGHVSIGYFGQRREAITDGLDGLSVGDYVYSQNGFIIRKVPADEAHKILETWRDLFSHLKEEDSRQSEKPHLANDGSKLSRILLKAANCGALSDDELLSLMSTTADHEIELICQTANNLRHRLLDNSCCVHGILEFSNVCKQGCMYCGIRAANTNINRLRLSIDEILSAAIAATERYGFKTLVLQSGEDGHYSDDDLVEIVRRVREKCGVLLFVSVGERSPECYERMYKAGARGALLRFETSNRRIYETLHPDSNHEERIDLLRKLSRMGYLIATGSLIGLPGQSAKDIIEDIRLAKSLNAEMYTFSPLIPAPDTPLANAQRPNLNDMLKLTSVIRFIVPNSRILVTTATELLRGDARELSLRAGGNSLMLNVTPKAMRLAYELYPGKTSAISLSDQIQSTTDLLKSIGRAPTDLGRPYVA